MHTTQNLHRSQQLPLLSRGGALGARSSVLFNLDQSEARRPEGGRSKSREKLGAYKPEEDHGRLRGDSG